MKNIKILLITAAALFALSSCYEKREFTPETGNTPVDFVTTTISLTSEYSYIPVHQLADASNHTKVTIEVLGCTATHLDGSTLTLVDGSDIIFTSKELYVAPLGEEGDGESSFEVRLPGYADYQDVAISVKLTGPDTNIETTVTLQGVTRYNMSGYWNLDTWGTLFITEDENDYTKFYVTLLSANDVREFPAVRSVNTLTIDQTATFNYGGFDYFVCLSEAAGSLTPSSPAEFTFSSDNAFTTTGIFIGYNSGGYRGYVLGAGNGTRIE